MMIDQSECEGSHSGNSGQIQRGFGSCAEGEKAKKKKKKKKLCFLYSLGLNSCHLSQRENAFSK